MLEQVSIDAWISGLGSFLGALIAGILAAIISTTIFKKERKEKTKGNSKAKTANITIGLIYENITMNLLEFVDTIKMNEKEFNERKRYMILLKVSVLKNGEIQRVALKKLCYVY